jgi:hypothetical protein
VCSAKGQHWTYLPLAPDVVQELRASMRELQPELDDYLFTTEVEHFVSQYERVRKRKNPKEPASEQALWRMLHRVCKRARRGSDSLPLPAPTWLRKSLPP